MDIIKLNSLAWHLRKAVMDKKAANETVSICAWCDPLGYDARAMRALGMTITHGICARHREKMLATGKALQRPLEALHGVKRV